MKKIFISILVILISGPCSWGINPPNTIGSALYLKDGNSSIPFGNNIGSQPVSLPQGGNTSVSYTSKGIYFNLIPSYTSIFNSDISKDENWKLSNGFGLNFEAGYLNKFNETIGLGIGLGYSRYTSEITSDPIHDYGTQTMDDDNDPYNRMVSTTSINEKTSIGYLDIPIFLDISNTNIDKIGYYGRVGVKISTPIASSITYDGLATIQGYYEQYNVLLYGIPPMGFHTNKEIYEDPAMDLKPINISLLISGGISIPISNYFILKAGVNANFGLTEISNQKAEDFDVSKYDGNYSKLLENPNATTTTRSLGLEIGVIYNLGFY